jgi:hypothetical protein
VKEDETRRTEDQWQEVKQKELESQPFSRLFLTRSLHKLEKH